MAPSTLAVSIPVLSPRVRWAALGLLAGLVTAVVAGPALTPHPILAADPAAAPEHTISVTGTGRVVISPDIADLRLGVSIIAKTVKDARAANASAMTDVITSLRKLGIAERDIQTTILSLQPVYDYSTNSNVPRLTGYNLSNGIAVTIRNLDVVGDAIDGALGAGATTMDGVTFRVEDQAAAERQAREAAMAEAKSKAQILAAAAGVSITGVASISETVAPIPYPVYYGALAGAAQAQDARTPVQPGTNEVSVTVAVVYVMG
ncbi:MAG: SIMPL domain-containing protein [Chloroflexi bacterium]|nr:SIMPL domain-containing protein [Chloroflexota bacterium]